MGLPIRVGVFTNDMLNAILQQTGIYNGPPLAGSADALPQFGWVLVNSSGVDAMTLQTPISGDPSQGGPANGQDGFLLIVEDISGKAHTITTAANIINGNKKTATFNGTAGSFVEFLAQGGKLWVGASTGVALT